jgi:small subunit ribosomal protein S16
MLSIRLTRIGKKKQPSYRVIVVDKKKDPWGKYLENLGFYNPRTNPKTIDLKVERIKYWISKGAQASATVNNMLVDAKILTTKVKASSAGKKPAEAPKAEAKPEVKA